MEVVRDTFGILGMPFELEQLSFWQPLEWPSVSETDSLLGRSERYISNFDEKSLNQIVGVATVGAISTALDWSGEAALEKTLEKNKETGLSRNIESRVKSSIRRSLTSGTF